MSTYGPRSAQFNRTSRDFGEPLPDDEIEVPEPIQRPPQPQKPNLLVLLLPTFTIGMAGIINIIRSLGSSDPFWWVSFLFLSTAFIYPSVYWYIYHSSKKEWDKQVAELGRRYETKIEEIRERLTDLQNSQFTIAQKMTPPASVLLDRARKRDSHLWERQPRLNHEDFLSLRVGTYVGKSSYSIKFLNHKREDEYKPIADSADAMAKQFASVSDVPCTIKLPDVGSIGIAGKQNFRTGLVRTLISNIVVHHHPSEVRLYAVHESGSAQVVNWGWLKWLPHIRPIDSKPAQQIANTHKSIDLVMKQLLEELQRRDNTLRNEGRRASAGDWAYLVVLIEDPYLVKNQEAVNLIRNRGTELKAGAIYLADNSNEIPSGCGVVIEEDRSNTSKFSLTYSKPGEKPIKGTVELTDVKTCEAIARALAPLKATSEKGGEIPTRVNLCEIFDEHDPRNITTKKIKQLWSKHSDVDEQLTIPLGIGVGNKHRYLSLHPTKHGPHGLIAGTTRTGKSVLLTSFISALAATHSPKLLKIALLDLKGDGDLQQISQLRHVVGFVTTLSDAQGNAISDATLFRYIERAILSLNTEIKKRLQIIADEKATEIFNYNQRHPKAPLPYLIVIIDEFAVLKEKGRSELITELIQTAAKGGAAGVHLILSTQTPGSGTVNEKILANFHFRICLRVANAAESKNILNREDAFEIASELRGRAILQVGDNEVFEHFQTSYGGKYIDDYDKGGNSEKIEIAEFLSDASLKPLNIKLEATPSKSHQPSSLRELDYLIKLVNEASDEIGVTSKLDAPWLPALPQSISLRALLNNEKTYRAWRNNEWSVSNDSRYLRVPIGEVDDPINQSQYTLEISFLDKHQHLWIGGGIGAGAPQSMRALILSIALTHCPDEVYIYCIGGGGFALLSALPHVGAIIDFGEKERLQRLMTMLERTLATRKAQPTKPNENDNQNAASFQPGWIIMVDDLGILVQEANSNSPEASLAQDILDRLVKLLAEGAAYNVHFVFTTTTFSLYKTMKDKVNGRLALRFPGTGDNRALLEVPAQFVPEEHEGRGLWKMSERALECQVAVYKESVEDIANQMQVWSKSGKPFPSPVEVMRSNVPLGEILKPPAVTEWEQMITDNSLIAIVGEDDERQPVTVDLTGHGPSFLVLGAPQSGKTNFLESLAISLAVRYNPDIVRLYGISTKNNRLLGTLGRLVNTRSSASSAQEAAQLLEEIIGEINQRKEKLLGGDPKNTAQTLSSIFPHIVLLIDDFVYDAWADKLQPIQDLGKLFGVHLVIAGDSPSFGGFKPWLVQIKESARGFIFVTAKGNSHLLNHNKVPKLNDRQSIPGRMFFAQASGLLLFQSCLYESKAPENSAINQWLASRPKPVPQDVTPPTAEEKSVPT